jgi:hypothetical protein
MSRRAADDRVDHPLAAEAVDLLHCLGFVYLRHGQARRATVLLMLAAQQAPARVDVLRTLAAALIAAGFGQRASDVLDTIETLDPACADDKMMRLMRARALLLQGRGDAARLVFRAMQSRRSDAAAPDAAPDRAAQDRAAQDRAAPDRAAADRVVRDREAQDRAAADRVARDREAPDKSAQDRASPDRSARDRMAPDWVAPDTAA